MSRPAIDDVSNTPHLRRRSMAFPVMKTFLEILTLWTLLTPAEKQAVLVEAIEIMVPRGGIEPPTRGFSVRLGNYSSHFNLLHSVMQRIEFVV
jgi:hypothetical protein